MRYRIGYEDELGVVSSFDGGENVGDAIAEAKDIFKSLRVVAVWVRPLDEGRFGSVIYRRKRFWK